jgi:hypothetical protein
LSPFPVHDSCDVTLFINKDGVVLVVVLAQVESPILMAGIEYSLRNTVEKKAAE